MAFASSLDQIGPMARTVEDAAVVLGVMAGADRYDSTAVDLPVPDYERSIGEGTDGLVVGVPKEYFPADLDGRIATICRAAAERLESMGAEVREISLPHTPYAIPAYYSGGERGGLEQPGAVRRSALRPTRPGAGQHDRRLSGDAGAGFGSEVKRRIVLGTYGLSAGYYDAYYGQGMRVRRLIGTTSRAPSRTAWT